MNLQKNITIPEILNLCETHGYNDVLEGLKQLIEKETKVAAKLKQALKKEYLLQYIKAGSFDGIEINWNDLPF